MCSSPTPTTITTIGTVSDVMLRDPQRFFVPPYVGGRGWLGVYLDVPREITKLLEDAYRMIAPRALS
jgi:hypothetical protein